MTKIQKISQKYTSKNLLSFFFTEISKNISFFKEENLFIATSVVYEENEEYAEALTFLNKFEPMIKDKAYFELRTKRLKERMANKPLFIGKRK